MLSPSHKLSEAQLDILEMLRFVNDEKELKEVKELLNLYFRKKLDEAIDKAEVHRGFSANVYYEWLTSNSKATQEDADQLADEVNAAWEASRGKNNKL